MSTGDGELARLDEDARRAAQTVFELPLVLEAGAGTGKTAVLVARIVSWCVGQGWARRVVPRTGDSELLLARSLLDGVVALTFTERATAEMEERVVAAFSRLARGESVVGFLPEVTGVASAELARRAGVLESVADHVRVSTIHSFCRQLLSQYPIEAAVHPAFTVDADGSAAAAIVEQTVMDRLRSCWGSPGDPRYEQLATLGVGPAELADGLGELIGRGHLHQWGRPAADFGEDVERCAARLRRNLFDWLEAIGDALVGQRARGLDRALQAQNAACRLFEDLERILSGDEVGLGALPDLVRESELAILLDCLKRWASSRFGVAEVEHLGRRCEVLVRTSRALHRQLYNLERVVPDELGLALEVLSELAADARERMRRAGVLAFPDLLQLASRLLERDAGVRHRVRSRIDQLLVDEFQDTDATQCTILRLLAFDGAAADRPGLFLVGDPKQSIYGWRDADMAAYEGFVGQIGRAGGARHILARNFRSVPAILQEVERVIAPVMREDPGLQPPFQPLFAASSEPTETQPFAPIEYWVAWDPTQKRTTSSRARDLEAAALADDLRRMHLQHDVPWRAMVVLMRTLTQQEPYLEALRRAGVPYVVERDQRYFRLREVVDAAALLRVVLDPLDELAVVTLLRSAVVGLPDVALYALCSRSFLRLMAQVDGVSDSATAAAQAEVESGASAIGQSGATWARLLQETIDVVGALRRARYVVPVDEWLDAVRLALPLEALEAGRYLGEHRCARLQSFFAHALEILSSAGGAEALVRQLRLAVSGIEEAEQAAGEGAEESVRVMSIHKAKGLTFDCVYLMGMHSAGRATASEQTLDWGTLADGSVELRLFGRPSLGFDLLEQRRAAVSTAEAVRTLYVACTRPRRRLVLSGCWPEGEDRSDRPLSSPAHLDLLMRRSGRPDLRQLWAGAANATGKDRIDDPHGVAWVALCSPDQVVAEQGGAVGSSGEREQMYHEPARLWSRQQEADERMRRPLTCSVTGLSEAQDSRPVQGGEGGSAEDARIAGTALHRLFETLDLTREVRPQLAQQRAACAALVGVERAGEAHERAQARVEVVIDRLLAGGQLIRRLTDIADHVMGREVPLLLRADTGVTQVGTIDLLYADPGGGEVVVADFKTDRVDSPDAVHQRARQYAAQGEAYCAAVARALGCTSAPRFELWFLWADLVLQV